MLLALITLPSARSLESDPGRDVPASKLELGGWGADDRSCYPYTRKKYSRGLFSKL